MTKQAGISQDNAPRSRAVARAGRGLAVLPAPGLVIGGIAGLQCGAALTTRLFPGHLGAGGWRRNADRHPPSQLLLLLNQRLSLLQWLGITAVALASIGASRGAGKQGAGTDEAQLPAASSGGHATT